MIRPGITLSLTRRARTIAGDRIATSPKHWGLGVRYVAGGGIFGLGWALTGACPGPIFALAGNGVSVIVVVIGFALAGTWTYGLLRKSLPHQCQPPNER